MKYKEWLKLAGPDNKSCPFPVILPNMIQFVIELKHSFSRSYILTYTAIHKSLGCRVRGLPPVVMMCVSPPAEIVPLAGIDRLITANPCQSGSNSLAD